MISKPILNDGLPLYFSNTSVCASTFTKYPLKNTTPSLIFATDERPTGVSVDDFTLNSLLLFAFTALPFASSVTSLISSDALNLSDAFVVDVLSVPC